MTIFLKHFYWHLCKKFFFDFPSKIQSCRSSGHNQPPPIQSAQFSSPSRIGLKLPQNDFSLSKSINSITIYKDYFFHVSWQIQWKTIQKWPLKLWNLLTDIMDMTFSMSAVMYSDLAIGICPLDQKIQWNQCTSQLIFTAEQLTWHYQMIDHRKPFQNNHLSLNHALECKIIMRNQPNHTKPNQISWNLVLPNIIYF